MATADELALIRSLISDVRPNEPLTLEQERAALDATPQPLPDGVKLEPFDLDPVPGVRLVPVDALAGRTVLFTHGGGYRVGSWRSHLRLAANLAVVMRATVRSIDYRLAPEHPCPAGVQDAVHSFHSLRAAGATDVILAGDSAGGGLALATSMALRDAGGPAPDAIVLLAPWLDLTCSGASFQECASVDMILEGGALRRAAAEYAGTRDLDDPMVSPLFGDLVGLPPILAQVGGADLLRDDSLRLGQRGALAGVDVTVEVEPDLPHVYHAFAGLLPDADAALGRVGAWVDARLEATVSRQE